MIHFFIFFILCRWSGLKWEWAIILILGIEVWETADWSMDDPIRWWIRFDTLMDILAGISGILSAMLFNRLAVRRKNKST